MTTVHSGKLYIPMGTWLVARRALVCTISSVLVLGVQYMIV